MKKIAVIILLGLVASLLIASAPVPRIVPPPTQLLTGTLRFSHSNICMIPDYIALTTMDNVYLTGKGFPTHGQIQGCQITALGTYASLGMCKVFQVSSYKVLCPLSADVAPTTLPDQ